MLTNAELFRLALAEAERSDDTTKVGAVFVHSESAQVLSVGHNHMPDGVDASVVSRWRRPEKYKWIEHAERNAIYAACKRGVSLSGSVAVLSWYPCVDCARALVQCGVHRIIATQPDESDATWGADFKIARTILEEGGVASEFVTFYT